MPRNKRGSLTPRGGRGGARGGTRGGRGGRGGRGDGGTHRGRGWQSPAFLHTPGFEEPAVAGFSLADEARHTSQLDHKSWAQSSNLRQRPVSFISAGTIEPLKKVDEMFCLAEKGKTATTTTEPATTKLASTNTPIPLAQTSFPLPSAQVDDVEASEGKDKVIGPEDLEIDIQSETAAQDQQPLYFFDLKGARSTQDAQRDSVPIPERPISRDSSSSDEVILFKGRDAQRKPAPVASIDMMQMQAVIHVVEAEMRVSDNAPPPVPKNKKHLPRNRRRGMEKMPSKSSEEEAIIADYIENMRENGDAQEFMEQQAGNRRDLGGTEIDAFGYSSEDDESDASSLTKDMEADEEGVTREEQEDTALKDEDQSESELDDELLAKLIAGHDLGMDDDLNLGDSPSDSDSSSAREKAQNRLDGEFDLMDWYRPSLRRKNGKGARAQINFNLSDSEMEQTLQVAWKNDRLKKSERKKQREELRALGMLGKKTKPEDLRVKYPSGMTMEEVAEELRVFLLGSEETLALPPMDNNARKMIHDLANKFKIKSKSTGKADQRRPILYRTGRTMQYGESMFNQAVNRVNRRYIPRLDVKGKRSQRPQPIRSNDAAASYQDGEIVGATAPELATDNRGRTMLEKMGWSTGTALGAMDNKGILQPVTHAMKRSKAGLG
ncbi:hypothetical protein G7046_g9608 [Stylonectria norvegica]|nr:hypothetical protein G7046_g9608 [Stylonectria norvegica]